MEAHRICVVTESFYPAVDGTTRTVKQVVDRLVDTGHEVAVVAPGPGLGSYRGASVARIRPLDKPGRQVSAALATFAPDLVLVASPAPWGARRSSTLAPRDVPPWWSSSPRCRR